MKKNIIVIISAVLLLACGNKRSQTDQIIIDNEPAYEQSKPDSVDSFIKEEIPDVEEKRSVPRSSSTSSSTRSNKSSGYDNMRGFDPASEDDMDDNGISRYMENDDEEGWD